VWDVNTNTKCEKKSDETFGQRRVNRWTSTFHRPLS